MEETLLKWKKAILLQIKILEHSYSESLCIAFSLIFQITIAKEEHSNQQEILGIFLLVAALRGMYNIPIISRYVFLPSEAETFKEITELIDGSMFLNLTETKVKHFFQVVWKKRKHRNCLDKWFLVLVL